LYFYIIILVTCINADMDVVSHISKEYTIVTRGQKEHFRKFKN